MTDPWTIISALMGIVQMLLVYMWSQMAGRVKALEDSSKALELRVASAQHPTRAEFDQVRTTVTESATIIREVRDSLKSLTDAFFNNAGNGRGPRGRG